MNIKNRLGLSLPGGARGPLVLCWMLCGIWWIASLWQTAGVQPLMPDPSHIAGLARNLVRGFGYTIEWIPFHLGFHDSIRHVPEWHGLARPVVLAGLFWIFDIGDDLIRVPGFTYIALTGVVTFAFARRLFGPGAGLLACLLTLSNRSLSFWSWAGTDDTGFVFFFMCTVYFCYLGLTHSQRFIPLAGCAAALALLEKQTALYLPGLFVVVLILGRGRGAGLRWALWLFCPLLLALAAYMVRNEAAYGGLTFRLGVLNWLFKLEGPRAIYALMDPAPSLYAILASVGPAKVVSVQFDQLKALFDTVFLPSPHWSGRGLQLLAVGVPSLGFHFRRHPQFVWLCLLSILGGVVFICGLYSVESRYFLMFVPLVSVSLAGVISRAWQGIDSGKVRQCLRVAAAVAATAIPVYTGAVNWSVDDIREPDHRSRCPAVLGWIERHVPPGEPLLTSNPWWVSWATDRPAVMIPTGGAAQIERVARHYGARFEFDLDMSGLNARRAMLGFRSEALILGKRCKVYRLQFPEH
ncbi:MAG: glycosyltransferase family 39 protein [bacterium]|nr:glycosyltransferase family 39 protein [bacterium]